MANESERAEGDYKRDVLTLADGFVITDADEIRAYLESLGSGRDFRQELDGIGLAPDMLVLIETPVVGELTTIYTFPGRAKREQTLPIHRSPDIEVDLRTKTGQYGLRSTGMSYWFKLQVLKEPLLVKVTAPVGLGVERFEPIGLTPEVVIGRIEAMVQGE